jgi:hypothetical protein
MIDRSALEAVLDAADPPELLALAGELQGRAFAKLVTQPPASMSEARWLTPDEAAEVARSTKRQIYEWAVGKRWARRPSRKKLLIEERGFRSWLASRP